MREYFCAFHSMRGAMRKLSDAEVGRLFRGLLYYSETGEQPTNLQGREELLFDVFSQQIDREREKYLETCARNKSNRAAQTVTNHGEPSRPVTTRHELREEKDKEKDKDKDKHTPLRERFERFWTAYPRKAGKGAAEKAWNSLKPDEALLQSMLTAITAQKSSSQWQRDNGQYIPYPATWLNQKRWEDEAAQPQAIVYAGNDDYGGDLF